MLSGEVRLVRGFKASTFFSLLWLKQLENCVPYNCTFKNLTFSNNDSIRNDFRLHHFVHQLVIYVLECHEHAVLFLWKYY